MSDRLIQRAGPPASLTIRGARLLDPAAGIDEMADIVIRDGVVGGSPDGLAVIDGSGCVVTPGLVDPHVHLRTPGREDCEDIASGSRSAAAGGYVAILGMPNTAPVVDSASILESLRRRAAAEAVIPVGFYASITVGLKGETLTEQAELARLGAAGFTDDGRPVWNAQVFRRALQYQRLHGLPLVLHEEDRDLSGAGVVHEGAVASRLGLEAIPGVSESIAVGRDCALAQYEAATIHICHVSAWETVEEVRRWKALGVAVTAEVTPHHLVLTDGDIEPDIDPARHKMNPPLRASRDRDALIAGLIDGTIDCVATDHAPHAANEKDAPFEDAPFGVTGLETAFAVLYTDLVLPGTIDLALLIRRMSTDAARVVGLSPPTLASGATANLALIDLEGRSTVGDGGYQSKSTNNAFVGRELAGVVRTTIAGGQIAWQR
jgi:dihydroorotase